MSKTDLFVTSDTKQAGQGIYRLTLDRLKGKLEGPWLYYECAEAKALSRYHYELAVVCAKPEHAGVALLDSWQKKRRLARSHRIVKGFTQSMIVKEM